MLPHGHRVRCRTFADSSRLTAYLDICRVMRHETTAAAFRPGTNDSRKPLRGTARVAIRLRAIEADRHQVGNALPDPDATERAGMVGDGLARSGRTWAPSATHLSPHRSRSGDRTGSGRAQEARTET